MARTARTTPRTASRRSARRRWRCWRIPMRPRLPAVSKRSRFRLTKICARASAVWLGGGEVGFGYPLGRDRQKAQMIALCDAMVQSNEFADAVEEYVLAPLRAVMLSIQNRKAKETAATRVDFYTLVRGEG